MATDHFITPHPFFGIVFPCKFARQVLYNALSLCEKLICLMLLICNLLICCCNFHSLYILLFSLCAQRLFALQALNKCLYCCYYYYYYYYLKKIQQVEHQLRSCNLGPESDYNDDCLKPLDTFGTEKKKVHRFTYNFQGLQKVMVKDFPLNIIP